jgi:hypothetical protein
MSAIPAAAQSAIMTKIENPAGITCLHIPVNMEPIPEKDQKQAPCALSQVTEAEVGR